MVPAYLKVAAVTPLLKKHSLDLSVLKNYRPISVLPFISKVLENIACFQLQSFLAVNNLFEHFQSGFKTAHSTESALLRVLNDIFLAKSYQKQLLSGLTVFCQSCVVQNLMQYNFMKSQNSYKILKYNAILTPQLKKQCKSLLLLDFVSY